MIRLLDGVYVWSAFDPAKRFNFNGHLLKTGEGVVLVDPVPMSPDDLAYVETAGLRPDELVITNRNHLRDRGAVVARWGTPTALHAAEIDEAGLQPERALRGGDVVRGLRVVELPGKSPGEIGLYWPERRLLLLGDALIAPYGALKTVPLDKQDDPARLRSSLRTLLALDFDVLLVGDGDPILRGAKDAVAAFLGAR